MIPDFVDRAEQTAQLRELAVGLTQGRGGALVVEGQSGIGKTALLTEFARRIGSGPEGGSGSRGGRGLPRVVQARCSPGIGPDFTFGPVIDILSTLHSRPTRGEKVRRAWTRTGLTA